MARVRVTPELRRPSATSCEREPTLARYVGSPRPPGVSHGRLRALARDVRSRQPSATSFGRSPTLPSPPRPRGEYSGRLRARARVTSSRRSTTNASATRKFTLATRPHRSRLKRKKKRSPAGRPVRGGPTSSRSRAESRSHSTERCRETVVFSKS